MTIRPPAVEAHYHRPESEELFEASVDYLSSREKAKMVMLPRYDQQAAFIQEKMAGLFSAKKMIIPPKVVDGLNLIWFSDFVVSGGGTINREAAALSVPVYSIFRGKIGAVDQYLSENSKLVLIANSSDLQTKMTITHRNRPHDPDNISKKALNTLVDHVISYSRKAKGLGIRAMKILSVVSARPNFMKIAPIISAIESYNAGSFFFINLRQA